MADNSTPKSNTPASGRVLSDDACREAFNALEATKTPRLPTGNQSQAAQSLGLDRSTFRNRLRKFFARGMAGDCPVHVPTGMEIRSESTTTDKDGGVVARSIKTGRETGDQFEVPPDYLLERGTFQTDGNGDLVQQWLKLKKDAPEINGAIEAIKAACAEMTPPRRPALIKPRVNKDLLNLHPLADLHLGMFAWGRETHGPDWDLKTAVSKYEETMTHVMTHSPTAGKGIILGGGDLVHADNMDNQTRRSGNTLDVDSRYQKVVRAACELVVFQTELALNRYTTVEVRILPGNHDEHVATAVTHFCDAWFRNEDRVMVDTDPGDFWFRQHGLVMLSANHGHKTKITDLPSVMANREAKMWGNTEFRYGHGFHIHHKTQHIFEDGGAICETHQSPVASDAYHAGGRYVSGRSMSSITYDSSHGESGRVTRTLRD